MKFISNSHVYFQQQQQQKPTANSIFEKKNLHIHHHDHLNIKKIYIFLLYLRNLKDWITEREREKKRIWEKKLTLITLRIKF